MKVIFDSNHILKKIVGDTEEKFSVEDCNIKFSRFCVTLKVKDGVLVYNSLVRSMVLLTEEEYKNHKIFNENLVELYKNYFLVKDDGYAESMANKIQAFIITHKPKQSFEKITTITILPSTGCNAKCFYCFEQGAEKKHMSIETADKVVKYIINHYNGKKVRIRWFGGEPLINEKIITYISQKLIENNINFDSTMISNCFLISEEKVSLYKEVWNLKKMSVTIDGTEDIYNNIKQFSYSGSAYKKVVNNIHILANAEIPVSIRINVGLHNIDDNEKLVYELLNEFKNKKKVGIYLNRLYDNFDGAPQNSEELKKVYNKIFELSNVLQNNGKGSARIKINDKTFKTHQCMADCGRAVMVLPDGKLGLCEHYMEDLHIGDIENGVTNYENVQKCCEQKEKNDICRKCCLYPTCINLKVCSSSNCNDTNLKYKEYFIKVSMKKHYNKFKKENKDE